MAYCRHVGNQKGQAGLAIHPKKQEQSRDACGVVGCFLLKLQTFVAVKRRSNGGDKAVSKENPQTALGNDGNDPFWAKRYFCASLLVCVMLAWRLSWAERACLRRRTREGEKRRKIWERWRSGNLAIRLWQSKEKGKCFRRLPQAIFSGDVRLAFRGRYPGPICVCDNFNLLFQFNKEDDREQQRNG